MWLSWLLAAQARPLTLSEAVATAVVNHPDVVDAQWLRARAEARLAAARASSDPTWTASGSTDTSESAGFVAGYASSSERSGWDTTSGLQGELPTGTRWSVELGLTHDRTTTTSALGGVPSTLEQSTWSSAVGVDASQDLLAFLRASDPARVRRTAAESLSSAELALVRSMDGAVAATAEAWWAWWTADAARGVAERSFEQAAALVQRTEQWFEAGEVARLEVDRVTAERLGAERDLLRAQAAVRASADALLVAMGAEPGQEIEPAGPERLWVSDPPDLETARADAVAGNLDLAEQQLALEAALAAAGDARDDRLPALNLTGSVGLSTLADAPGAAVTQLGTADDQPRASVALDLAVPLGGRAARASRDDAETEVSRLRSRRDAVARSLDAEVRAAVDAWTTADRGVGLAEARVVVARATEDGEQARVDEGVRRLDEWLDAVAARESAEADAVGARVERASAELALARLGGRALAEAVDVE
ncbi:MAG: TolC family protein [Myxococcota bacterium]